MSSNKMADYLYEKIFHTYKRVGRIQAREMLLKLTIPDLRDICYSTGMPSEGSKTKLVDTVMHKMEIQHNLSSADSVKFFDDEFSP
jgi:hypothetical protein